MIAALSTSRARFDAAGELLQFAGIASVTEQSGKQKWVHWRWASNKFLSQSKVEWAGLTIKQSFWARNFYAQERAKGKSPGTAVRALAFKWLRIIFRLWQDRTLYNESKYLLALQKSGSPLLQTVPQTA